MSEAKTTIPEPLATSLRLYPERDKRVGMRSAMNDAAAACDLIAESIRRGGRPSKRRAEMVAVAERCAATIAGLRDMVGVPHD